MKLYKIFDKLETRRHCIIYFEVTLVRWVSGERSLPIELLIVNKVVYLDLNAFYFLEYNLKS